MRGIHRGPLNSPHKWPVTRKMFLFDDVIMIQLHVKNCKSVINVVWDDSLFHFIYSIHGYIISHCWWQANNFRKILAGCPATSFFPIFSFFFLFFTLHPTFSFFSPQPPINSFFLRNEKKCIQQSSEILGNGLYMYFSAFIFPHMWLFVHRKHPYIHFYSKF